MEVTLDGVKHGDVVGYGLDDGGYELVLEKIDPIGGEICVVELVDYVYTDGCRGGSGLLLELPPPLILLRVAEVEMVLGD